METVCMELDDADMRDKLLRLVAFGRNQRKDKPATIEMLGPLRGLDSNQHTPPSRYQEGPLPYRGTPANGLLEVYLCECRKQNQRRAVGPPSPLKAATPHSTPASLPCYGRENITVSRPQAQYRESHT